MVDAHPQRVAQLDSMRGIAAISVVLSHYVLVFVHAHRPGLARTYGLLRVLSETPLGLLRAARAALIFFFILGGYVISYYA